MSCWYAIEGERLCRVRRLSDRQHIDGTLELTLPRQEGVVVDQSGLFEVHDDRDGVVYLAQALSCRYADEAMVLSCTPLGAMVQEADRTAGDNFLVVSDQAPIPIRSLILAQSQCPKGDHLRIEVDAKDWGRFDLPTHGHCACQSCACRDEAMEYAWDFRSVSCEEACLIHPPAEVVMLRQRQRVTATIDLVHSGAECATLIAHARLRRDLSGMNPVPYRN